MQKVPIDLRGEEQIFTLAVMLRHFGEEYDQISRYLSNYETLFADIDKILAKFDLVRSPEKREATPRQKETPLTDIPISAELSSDIAPEWLLLVALERQDVSLLEEAITQGADLNARIQRKPLTGCTPLMAALNLKQSEAALRLIEAGADASARRSDRNKVNPEKGQTALSWAAIYGDVTVIDALLAVGAPIDSLGTYDSTPLANAVDYGHIEIVERFLEAGADLQHPAYGKSPLLDRAVKYDEIEMVQHLLEIGVDIEARNRNGATALLTAIDKGFVDHVKLLLSYGANPNVAYTASGANTTPVPNSKVGMTPLALAAQSDRLTMAKVLLKGGADPDQLVVKPGEPSRLLVDFATKRKDKFSALFSNSSN